MAEIGLDGPSIDAVVGQFEAAGGSVHRTGARTRFKSFIPGLTRHPRPRLRLPSAAPLPEGSSEFFKKILDEMLDLGPFCVEVPAAPPNEESRSSGRQGNKKRPLSTSPTKSGAPGSAVP